jgi:hypothetical protein
MVTGAAFALPMTGKAQTPFNEAGTTLSKEEARPVGGTPTIDQIVIRTPLPGIPLRKGNVIKESEVVEFNGERLQRGKDYTVDYEAGVLYLMRIQKAGQSVRVSYRYDSTKTAVTETRKMGFSTGLPAYKFELVPGGSKAVFGLGMAERQADGQVMMSNLYGVETKARGLNGLMLVGERSKVDNRSNFEYQEDGGATDTGRSKLILQNYQGRLGGGMFEADFQDVSSNFTGFGAVTSAGFSQETADRLSKERGLKRMSFSMKEVSFGPGTKLSNGFRQVRDGAASIDWRSFGLDAGGLKFNYNSQRIDSDFTRFQDLAEQDRDQLRNEAGLSRQNLSAAWANKFTNLSYSNTSVEDAQGNGITRRNVELKGQAFGINFGDQSIDQNFTRFGNLWEQERGQWGREAGLHRKWFGLDVALRGREMQPLIRHSTIESATGQFQSSDLALKAGGWALDVNNRKTSTGFQNLGSLTEGEMDGHIRTIARMYDANQPTDGNMRGQFLQGIGIDRNYAKLAGNPFKKWNFSLERMEMEGQEDKLTVDTFALGNDKFKLNFRKQSQGLKFNEIFRTMEFEKQRLGLIAGLERSDFGLELNLDPKRALKVDQMKAETEKGSAERQMIAYRDPKLQVSVTTRKVDPAFDNVNQLVDPERDLLNALRGNEQRDVKLAWQLNKNVKFDLFQFGAKNSYNQQEQDLLALNFNWQLDSKTNVDVHRFSNKQTDPLSVLFSHEVNRINLMRDLGKYGKLQLLNETIRFDGQNGQAPDSHRQYMAYETQVSPTTAVKTEQTRTTFSNGDKEEIRANTVSTELTKKAGVSMTDLKVNRNGDDRDETRRNYGFWFDFGKGMRLSYGYVRQINGANGTLNSNVSITPGTLDFLKIDQANYAENRWDNQRSQGLSNVALGSSRPLQLGVLRDVNFNFSMDTATDQSAWVRENRLAGFDGRIGANKLSVQYRSQMHASGFRGIDRAFAFETDQNDKRWFKGSARITARQMPDGSDVMIRDLGFSLRGPKGFNLSHRVTTNPEDPNVRPDLPMFRFTNPMRISQWNLAWNPNGDTGITGSWEERLNDQTFESSRLSGLTVDLFKKSGSPLSFFVGMEQRWGNQDRSTAAKYWVRYDQQPGPNQVLSFYLSNITFYGAIPGNQKKNNLTLNVNYQLKF